MCHIFNPRLPKSGGEMSRRFQKYECHGVRRLGTSTFRMGQGQMYIFKLKSIWQFLSDDIYNDIWKTWRHSPLKCAWSCPGDHQDWPKSNVNMPAERACTIFYLTVTVIICPVCHHFCDMCKYIKIRCLTLEMKVKVTNEKNWTWAIRLDMCFYIGVGLRILTNRQHTLRKKRNIHT